MVVVVVVLEMAVLSGDSGLAVVLVDALVRIGMVCHFPLAIPNTLASVDGTSCRHSIFCDWPFPWSMIGWMATKVRPSFCNTMAGNNNTDDVDDAAAAGPSLGISSP